MALIQQLSTGPRRDAAQQPSSFVWTRVAQEIRTVAHIATTLKTIWRVFDGGSRRLSNDSQAL